MQLKTYIEKWSQYDEGLSNREKIEIGRTKLFDFDYPFFSEEYRKDFETHFIRNFYMREIGFETEGLFKFQLETWLLINMPYFNKLFESELIEFDPLENSSVDVTHNKTNDTKQKANAESSGTGKRTDDNFARGLDSNNPDSRLQLTANDGEGVIEYASSINEENENNVSETESSNSGSSNSDINSVEDYIQHRGGKIGVQTYSRMVQEYRDIFLRIERNIFNEMNELFMLVY